MSGGVDSSVAAALMVQRGYHPTGVTMKTWDGPPSAIDTGKHGCYGAGELEDIRDAGLVADVLGMPFHVVDLSREYRAQIIDYFREQSSLGNTPNPCSRCNPRIKFGSLLSKVRESGVRFDCFATGHYARVEYSEESGRYQLKRARDKTKDQSYFLAFLSQEQLGVSLFPLGDMLKSEVRQLARDLDLPVAAKKDSQDFTGGDLAGIRVSSALGPILDKNGNRLGTHKGIAYHTIGQRHGLGISGKEALYVTGLDPARNAVVVGSLNEVYGNSLTATELNWIAMESLTKPVEVGAKIRSRHDEAHALVSPIAGCKVYVEFKGPQLAITPGQTIVFYDGDIVIGAGVIEKAKE